MVRAFTKRHSEYNTGGCLQFTFYCDICRREYAAPAVEAPNKQGLFQKQRLQRAYLGAFDKAQEDAKEHFNRCVKCKQWVCDKDFSPDYGLCVECDRDNGKGE